MLGKEEGSRDSELSLGRGHRCCCAAPHLRPATTTAVSATCPLFFLPSLMPPPLPPTSPLPTSSGPTSIVCIMTVTAVTTLPSSPSSPLPLPASLSSFSRVRCAGRKSIPEQVTGRYAVVLALRPWLNHSDCLSLFLCPPYFMGRLSKECVSMPARLHLKGNINDFCTIFLLE